MDKYKNLINTEEFIGKFMTDDSITKYYEALNGITKEVY